VEGEVQVLRVAEERILRDVAVDAVLTGDLTDPVAAGVAVYVAARQKRHNAAPTKNTRSVRREGDDCALNRGDLGLRVDLDAAPGGR